MTGLAVPQEPIEVTLLTGFLGSGKTTVLRHLLDQPEMAATAVIVNEFGDVGLDHLLLERSEEDTLLLDSGCLCCTLKSDLVVTLQSLLERAERGDLPAFERVVIETTGLADPGALISAFWSDPLRLSRYRFARTVTCIDAIAGAATLARHGEARRQAALADLMLITKTDMRSGDAVIPAARTHNREAPVREVRFGDVPAAALFAASTSGEPAGGSDMEGPRHASDIAAVSVTVAGALSWNVVETELGALTQKFGDRLLRVKGLLVVEGIDGAVRVDAVQGLFHRPDVLSQNLHGDPVSRLVEIAQGIDESVLRCALAALLDRSAAHEVVSRPA